MSKTSKKTLFNYCVKKRIKPFFKPICPFSDEKRHYLKQKKSNLPHSIYAKWVIFGP